jgi:hypothetical protein
MAYKQNPGRGDNKKTGHGVPAPFKQYNSRGQNATTAGRYDDWDTNNPKFKIREYANQSASRDSSAVANKAIKFGVSPREAKKMGSEAANATRVNFGQGDLKVDVKTIPGGEKYTQKVKPGTNPKTGAKVKVVPPVKQKMSKKMSPMKQTKSTAKKMQDTPMAKRLPKDPKRGTKYEPGKPNAEMQRVYKASPAKQGLNFSTKEDMAKSGMKPYKGSDRQKANEKGNAKANEARKTSPAKQCFPSPQEKADTAKKNFENRKNNPSDAMGKGPSKDAMKERGSKYEPGSAKGKVYKDSPAKQLGRQAVTKMGGKKTPVKMCGKKAPAKMKKC